jgi:uncharacterized damage-inducible protein DinB
VAVRKAAGTGMNNLDSALTGRISMHFNKEALLLTFQKLPEMIEAYFENIPENCLDIRRKEAAWTIREHLYHIIGVQEMLYQRMQTIHKEEKPVITPYFPDKEQERENLYESVKDALSHYKEMREKQIRLIRQMEEPDFSKEAVHAEYINYNLPIVLNHMVFHEYWHMYRIEELWLARDEYLQ